MGRMFIIVVVLFVFLVSCQPIISRKSNYFYFFLRASHKLKRTWIECAFDGVYQCVVAGRGKVHCSSSGHA